MMQPVTTQQFPLDLPCPIFPSRLLWLCQPEQIEHTLRLLYYLNGWKNARQRLLYEDRQGLSEVQALVLQQAIQTGIIQPVGYIDGSGRFPDELLLESAAVNAARGVLIHIKELCNPTSWPPFWPDGSTIYQHFIRPLYRRITGEDFKHATDATEILDLSRISAYIQAHLHKLIERAQSTRSPLSAHRLSTLCIAPVDLLPIKGNRLYFLDSYDAWEDLDSSDLRKLDPEGFSKLAFQYASPRTEYLFHLSFRRAESLLSSERLHALQQAPRHSIERGLVQGQSISEQEGMARPVREILQDLGVDVTRVCPRQLQEKALHLSQAAMRDMLWPVEKDDHDDWDDDPWDGRCLPPEPRGK